ncbi:poly-gamma-glutamate hydrolase family protein [Staphylococcus sp. Marseille-Q5304]|uniref:poly-gamma-glutamate hydrolase family protein n=1 Tax=Staphylococcus sp. Marseille-Q5304 TaxID=2942200 RepID=UPI002072C5CA|nr:poly-gamma-glutamate hydrolase family protein [Staphylococcus sp. Marseille-Q5304]
MFKSNALSRYLSIPAKFILASGLIIIMILLISYKPIFASDEYDSMTDLMEDTKEGEDWVIFKNVAGSDTLIAAIHGGNIEAGTTELAKLTANLGTYNYYTFKGIRRTNNDELHVISTNYNEPTLEEMQEKVSNSVMIHGAHGNEPVVYLGGKDSDLREEIGDNLEDKGFNVEETPDYLEGRSDDNIANKNGKKAGVQLELTTALRQSFFKNDDLSAFNRENADNWTEEMHDFAEAIHEAVH